MRDLCVCLFHPSVLWCHGFSPRPQYMTCDSLLGPLILSVTLLLVTSFPGEEEGNLRPRSGANELFWKWQQPPPQKHPALSFATSGWEQSCGGRLKTRGKVGGQKLTAATSGKAHSGQPFALRVPKFFSQRKKRKKPHKQWYSLCMPSGLRLE